MTPTSSVAAARPTSPGTAGSGPELPSAPQAPAGSVTVPPTDEIAGVWVLGTVDGDSSGPCYRITTQDGRSITAYSTTAGSFAGGQRIRALVVSPPRALYCGSEEALRLLDTKRAG